jgi:tetratricopeptide (TPR) repeat protein
MDGRRKLVFAGGLVALGLAGCTTTKPTAPEAPPPQLGKNSIYVPEPADDPEKKDGPLACSTMVLFANLWVEMVAKDPNKPAAEREQLLNKARTVYQDVLQREPKNVDALLGLGQMYQVAGEADKLREVEQRLISQYPQNAKVWAWVAVRQAQAKNWDAAIESYQHAVKLDPENRVYRTHLGFTLARAGRYPEGYEWLSRSMREPDARFNLAKMMIHNGEVEKARAELRLCLKADPEMKAAGDLLSALANGLPQSGNVLPEPSNALPLPNSVAPQPNSVPPLPGNVPTLPNYSAPLPNSVPLPSSVAPEASKPPQLPNNGVLQPGPVEIR